MKNLSWILFSAAVFCLPLQAQTNTPPPAASVPAAPAPSADTALISTNATPAKPAVPAPTLQSQNFNTFRQIKRDNSLAKPVLKKDYGGSLESFFGHDHDDRWGDTMVHSEAQIIFPNP